MSSIKNKVDEIWDFFEHKMFCEKTNLIYDYLSDGLTTHLPTPEEIARQVPNPCGWGTGMEDSMINNPMMLDAIIYRYEVTKDEGLREFADKLLLGIKLCATISEERGFLARSVTPFDCKSHYINSSRDQYTQCVFALFHYYTSSMIKESDKEWIKDVLVSFAERAERNVTEENGYDLLREDGKRSIFCEMWGDEVKGHEIHRLHMIYLSAWYVSGDDHWFDLYKEIRDEGIVRARQNIEPKMEMYGFLQMQVSLRLLYDAEPEAEYKKKYEDLLKFVNGYVSSFRVEPEQFDYDKINFSRGDWRERPAINDAIVFVPHKVEGALLDGYPYYVPTSLSRNVIHVRDITEAIYILMLGNEKRISAEQIEDLSKVLEFFDKERHSSYFYISAIHCYWAAKYFGVELD